MITGRHNPGEYNGFKVMVGSSTIHGEEIQQVLEYIQKKDFLSGSGTEKTYDIVTPYVEEISAKFHFDRKLKIVVDGSNGVGGPVFHRLLEKLGAVLDAARQPPAALGHDQTQVVDGRRRHGLVDRRGRDPVETGVVEQHLEQRRAGPVPRHTRPVSTCCSSPRCGSATASTRCRRSSRST